MLAGFLSLFQFLSVAGANPAGTPNTPLALRQCVNDTLPGWSAVRAPGLTGAPRRTSDESEDAHVAGLWIDSAGTFRKSREGVARFRKGDLVVIAGIFPWGLRVSSSEKQPSADDYIDLDLVFDSTECSLVDDTWRHLFRPVEVEDAQRLLGEGEKGARPPVALAAQPGAP